MRVILADGEADMGTSASFENQDRACDRLNRLPEQKPVARPLEHVAFAPIQDSHVSRFVIP